MARVLERERSAQDARVQHIQTRSRQFGWLGHFRTSAGCSARNFAIRHFAGGYRHWLVRTPDGYRIKLQRVDLVDGEGTFDYVIQTWV